MANQKIRGCGFHHVAIYVRDYDRTIDFYTNVLGFEKKNEWSGRSGRAMYADIGDGGLIEIFEDKGAAEPQPGKWVHLALKVADPADLDKLMARVHALGLEIVLEPREAKIDGDHGSMPIRIGFFKGYEGEIFELFCSL